MKTVCLQIEDEFMESFLKMLPEDKVRVLSRDFANAQRELHEELENYLHNRAVFTPYYENMKAIESWLAEGKKS